MENQIQMRNMLQKMKLKTPTGDPVTFDIAYRTYNVKTRQGGTMKYYNDAKLVVEKDYTKSFLTENEKMLLPDRIRKNPNHQENRTINIELANGDKKTIRLDGIIKFNDIHVMP